MIEKRVFEENLDKIVRIGLKPNNFTIVGRIVCVFEDSIKFTSSERTSYLDFDSIMSLVQLDGDF